VGRYAVEQGIDVVIGIQGAARAFGADLFFDDPADAGRAARSIAQPGDAILFKGSRGVHVERALEQFLAPDEGSPS
jgi:UDP-N-acetylmuramoyl-tripeptide--D-alanyl-D-alanine ligase